MRVIETSELSRWEQRRRRNRQNRQRRRRLLLIVFILLSTGVGYWRYQRPLPAPVFDATQISHVRTPLVMSWPDGVQAAVGAVGVGELAKTDEQKSVPIASVNKVITALTVLNAKPLQTGQAGPNIMLTAQDEEIYRSYIAQGGSVAGVTAGRTITEYEALQALMLPSSNNMAETLTNWAFGSQAGYVEAANSYVQTIGLKDTQIADTSGFSPKSMSTASDLIVLAEKAMNEPVLKEIVAQKSAVVPVSGTITSTNRLLGVDGIIGLKTGNTNEAGGCFVAAANRVMGDGSNQIVLAVVLGAKDVATAMNLSRGLLNQVGTAYQEVPLITKSQQVGVVTTAWGSQSAVLADQDVKVWSWKDGRVSTQAQPSLASDTKGALAGSLQVTSNGKTISIPMTLSDPLPRPSVGWKLKRIFSLR